MSQLGNLSPGASVAVGVVVCLMSSGIQSVGMTLQRKSHMLEDEKYADADNKRPPYKRRRWQLGFSMFLVANLVGSTIQLTTLPLPVLAALQAAGLVFNSINASFILGESFTRWSLTGTVLVSVGAMLIAFYGALPEPAHSLHQLLKLFGREQFILWAVGQGILVLTIVGLLYLLRRIARARGTNTKIRLARGMCFGALSGMLAGHSVLMAKSAVELLVRTIVDRDNQFRRWEAWVILLLLVGIGLSQLWCLHSGLQLCSTSVLYPFVFCVYNVITILDGLIYFDQTDRVSGKAAGLITFGTMILLSGVVCLSWRLASEDDSNQRHHSEEVSETAENVVTPPVGAIGAPTERDPLLHRFTHPTRIPAYSTDEEAGARADLNSGFNGKEPGALTPPHLRLEKTRKHATFAEYGAKSVHRSPTSSRIRRPSLISAYKRARSRTMADKQQLLTSPDIANSGDSVSFTQRRFSHGDNGFKHGVPGNDDTQGNGDESRMTSSTPLLRRSETGRTYLDTRRRSSVPNMQTFHPHRQSGAGHFWHTVDASAGRPVDQNGSWWSGMGGSEWWKASRWRDWIIGREDKG